ncbi:MAG TPA: beta(1,3)galactosyltransferase EpsH [Peptococcaceae bacterium]|nr:beta(1,3)galactosyltransferase EpsH [Peptococcaceae bacterium]
MIFVILGSQKFQFNRLLKKIDELIEQGKIHENVFAQIGYIDYKPKYFEYKDFLDRDEFVNMIQKANIVITHGGTGSIIGAVKEGKKVIAVPRLAKYGEHVDDHQIQIIEQFDNLQLICGCMDCENILEALEKVKHYSYKKYISNTNVIINSIETFLERNLIH